MSDHPYECDNCGDLVDGRGHDYVCSRRLVTPKDVPKCGLCSAEREDSGWILNTQMLSSPLSELIDRTKLCLDCWQHGIRQNEYEEWWAELGFDFHEVGR